MKNHFPRTLAVLLIAVLAAGTAACGKKAAQEGDHVKVHYTGKLSDGTTFDSSVDREPLEGNIGQKQVIPGFEKALVGMRPGETKTVTIPVDEAYGPRREELVQTVDREKMPEDRELKVGDMLFSQLPDGRRLPVKITEVTETTVTLDANHPLAGKDLTFELEMVEISGKEKKPD